MIPKLKLKFLAFLLLLLCITACKDEAVPETPELNHQSQPTFSDTLFGTLSAKQQYYQHFIIEVPVDFQQNIDSLSDWVVAHQPGGLHFSNWNLDSITRFKAKVDTLDIIQPIYQSNYFEYLGLSPYPYWEASEGARDSNWTQVFTADYIGMVDFGYRINRTAQFDTWISDWKKRSNIGFITNQFSDKYASTEFSLFINTLKNTSDLIRIELSLFDTVSLDGFRSATGYAGQFVVDVDKEAYNKQLAGGTDWVYCPMESGGFANVDFEKWNPSTDDLKRFEESTKRILRYKQAIVKNGLCADVEARKFATSENLVFSSSSVLNGVSGLVGSDKTLKVYSADKIRLPKQLFDTRKFKLYKKDVTADFDNIKKADGVKICFVNDTVSSSFLDELAGLTEEDEIIVCFSDVKQYPQLATTPNLVYVPKLKDRGWNYEIALQQFTGQLSIGANFYYQDSLYVGEKITKTKLARTSPEFCGVNSDTLRQIDYAVKSAINGRAFPGCQVLIAKDGCIIYDKSFGHHSYDRLVPVHSESIYDLASLTKVISTTLMGMKLYEYEAYELEDSLEVHLPDTLKDHLKYPSTIRNLTFQELFIHKSGMPSGFPILQYMQYTNEEVGRFDKYYCDLADSVYCIEVAENFYLEKAYQDSMWLKLNQIWLDPAKEYNYSDVNMNTLYFMFKHLIQSNPDKFDFKNLEEDEIKERDLYVDFLYREFYEKLGMERTGYLPLKRFAKNEIVPTEDERFWRKQLLQGYVHDPNAALHGGVAGNAGVFSTTNDLAILAEMWLQDGTYGGQQFLKPETVQKFRSAQPNSHRGLGFNKPSLNTSAFGCADSAPVQTYGHTGFTGTCIWIDPVNHLTYIFLSNRVHPRVNNRIYQYGIRRRAHQLAYDGFLF